MKLTKMHSLDIRLPLRHLSGSEMTKQQLKSSSLVIICRFWKRTYQWTMFISRKM
nr:hypothetical protein Iba_chr15cCG2460 [Ipomoea batatas]